MNEKIKEFAKQAWPGLPSHWWDSRDGAEAVEKFAELIVRECAEQIVAKGTDWVDFAPSQTGVRPEYWAMAQQIKQHFGIEE